MNRPCEQAEKKRILEGQVVKELIALYCRDKHGKYPKNDYGLCRDCQELYDYAQSRIDQCPFMASKTFCSNCKVHCYEPRRREDIRQVMRYAGPRLLLKHPLMVIHHMCLEWLERKGLRK